MAFKGSLKRFRYLSKIGLFAITLIFAVNLIFLGDKILYDIDRLVDRPDRESFSSVEVLKEKDKEILEQNKIIKDFQNKKYVLEQNLTKHRRDLKNLEDSYSNWIEKSKASSSDKDNQLLSKKALELETQRKITSDLESKRDEFQKKIQKVNQDISDLYNEKSAIERQDDDKYNAEYKIYTVKVFFVRLAFVFPVLLIGLWFFLKFRKHKFRALVWGYILFALYAFFIGLLPHLPSYGGYIRYSVGIVLTSFIGYYLIKQLTQYTKRKEEELRASNEERAKLVQHETAIKAFDTHSCPSCEQDFLKNKWRPQAKKWQENIDIEEAPDFCRHCGLILFEKCSACGSRNFAHFPYCSNCGKELSHLQKK